MDPLLWLSVQWYRNNAPIAGATPGRLGHATLVFIA